MPELRRHEGEQGDAIAEGPLRRPLGRHRADEAHLGEVSGGEGQITGKLVGVAEALLGKDQQPFVLRIRLAVPLRKVALRSVEFLVARLVVLPAVLPVTERRLPSA